MKLEDAIRKLRDAEPALRAKGVSHAAIFGSTARGDRRLDSDLDILIDLDPAAHVTVYDYVAIRNDIASLSSNRSMWSIVKD